MGDFLSQLMCKLLGDGKPPESGAEIDGNICICCGKLSVAEHVEHEKNIDLEERTDDDD